MELLSTISNSTPKFVENQTLPLLFDCLPDRAPPREATIERAKYWQALSALSALCLQPQLFEILVVRLTTKLDLICTPTIKSQVQEAEAEPTAAYAHSILKTIAQTLSAKVAKGHSDVPKYIDRLVPSLYNICIYSAIMSNDNYMVATDPRIIVISGEIISLVMQSLSLSLVSLHLKVV
jgi:DNA repair/transcription protein MET18/MMS19